MAPCGYHYQFGRRKTRAKEVAEGKICPKEKCRTGSDCAKKIVYALQIEEEEV